MKKIRQSKFLSLVLRHKPQEIGLVLDAQGWASVTDLIQRHSTTRHAMSMAELETIVAESDKKRFTFSEDRTRIRAAQGHSVEVALGLEPKAPPDCLFHGTATRFVAAIRQEGLRPGRRQQVHLSPDPATARTVGARHGQPHIFVVDCKAMHHAGYELFQADNGVWLADHVPAAFLSDHKCD